MLYVSLRSATAPEDLTMSGTAKITSVTLILALGFTGCNKMDRGDDSPRASQPTAPAEEPKAVSQPVLKEPASQWDPVTLLRVPNGGIQPHAVPDAQGTLHLIYFKGENAGAGDVFYVRRDAGKERFSEPIRINSHPARPCAVGSGRGGQTGRGGG